MSGLKIGPAGEVELTREAKEAVRGYMLYLITLPAIGLTIISDAARFFINKVAFQGGYNEAYKAAVTDVVTASKAVELAKSRAEEALKTVEEQVKKATKASDEAMQTSEKASKFLTSNIEQLATTLAGTETFRLAANTVLIPGFGDLRGKLDALLQSLDHLTLYQKDCTGASISPCEVSCLDPQERLIGGLCLVPGGGRTGFVQKRWNGYEH